MRTLLVALSLLVAACSTVTPGSQTVVVEDRLRISESVGGKAAVTRVRGILTVQVTTPDGVTHRRVAMNAWPNAGEAYLVNAFRGIVPLADARYHGLGTSGVAFDETQTGCVAELTSQYGTDNVRATGSLEQGGTPSTFRSVGLNTIDLPGVVLGEYCLMTNMNVGQGSMMTRILITPPIAAPTGTTVTTTFVMTFE